MAAIFIAIAVLALGAGFYVLYSGRRSSEDEAPANHKVNIRKAEGHAFQEVTEEPPEGLSALEAAALEQEDDDPIDIFLDMDLPFECRLEAEDKLKDAGFKFSTSLRDKNSPEKNSDNTDNDVDDNDDAATDEGLEPDFVMTGE